MSLVIYDAFLTRRLRGFAGNLPLVLCTLSPRELSQTLSKITLQPRRDTVKKRKWWRSLTLRTRREMLYMVCYCDKLYLVDSFALYPLLWGCHHWFGFFRDWAATYCKRPTDFASYHGDKFGEFQSTKVNSLHHVRFEKAHCSSREDRHISFVWARFFDLWCHSTRCVRLR